MKAKITEIIKETDRISTFRLQPEAEFKYLPGQWMFVTIPQPSTLSPQKHHFTISSSPYRRFFYNLRLCLGKNRVTKRRCG